MAGESGLGEQGGQGRVGVKALLFASGVNFKFKRA